MQPDEASGIDPLLCRKRDSSERLPKWATTISTIIHATSTCRLPGADIPLSMKPAMAAAGA
eukprot:scaffold123776_cov60-Phaeocystis_antarctica.AAC.2